MGLEMLVAEEHRLWTLNTPRVPAGVDDAKVRQYLLENTAWRSRADFGPLAGKIFRIGLMGYGSTGENAILVLESLAAALKAQGYRPAGDGPAAAEKALAAAV